MKPLNQTDLKKGSIICVYFYMRKSDAGCELVSWVAITHKVLFQLWSVSKCQFFLLDFRDPMYHVGGIQAYSTRVLLDET